MADLVKQLNEDEENRLSTLKEIRSQLLQSSAASHFLTGNLKRLILALKSSLTPLPGHFRSQVESVQIETLKILEQLIYKNDPDLEIQFFIVLPSLIQLLDSPNEGIKDLALLCLKVYTQMTQNVEQILVAAIRNGIDNDNPQIRHTIIKALPDFISFGQSRQIDKTLEFRNTLEVLLIRARGDNTDSIRAAAQEALRELTDTYKESIVHLIMPKLTHQQREHLAELMTVQEEVVQQKEKAVETFKYNNNNTMMRQYNFDPAIVFQQPSTAVAFGAIPLSLVQHIEGHSDWKMKLKAVEDMERVMVEMSASQKQQLMNFASSFITFVEEHLIEDDNMKIVLTGLRLLKFVMKNAQMAEKTNLTKLIHSLIMKLNDPKEIVRIEIESFFVQLSYNMKTKSIILSLLQPFKTFRINNEGKQSLLRAVTSILLTQNGAASINDLQNLVQIQEDNIYMQVIEPISYLFANREEPLRTRYYAQEALAITATTLSRTHILEALYECLSDDKLLYDQFCDRLDAGLTPFISMVNGMQKLEYPLPQSHVFSVKTETIQQNHHRATIGNPNQGLPLHPRRLISDKKDHVSQFGKRQEQQSSHAPSEFNEYFSEINDLELKSQHSQPLSLGGIRKNLAQDGLDRYMSVGLSNEILDDGMPPNLKREASESKSLQNVQIHRRPFNNAAKEIVSSKANFNVEQPQREPYNALDNVNVGIPTALQISEKLKFLKARNSNLQKQPIQQQQEEVRSRQQQQPTPMSHASKVELDNKRGSQLKASALAQLKTQAATPYIDHDQQQHASQKVNAGAQYATKFQQHIIRDKNLDRIGSPPFYSAQVPDIDHETAHVFTNKFQYQAGGGGSSPPVNFGSFKAKPSYYQRFVQGSPGFDAKLVQTSNPNVNIPKPAMYDADNQMDDKISMNSDFSRGSAISGGIITNKKLENLQPKLQDSRSLDQINVPPLEELQPLDNPTKSLNLALLDLKNEKQWQKQNEACNVLRQALKYNQDRFNAQTIQNSVSQLMKLIDQPRSQLAKNAIQTLQEFFSTLGKQMDNFIEMCASVILKKCSDTNVFLSESSRLAIEEMCQHCNEGKLMQALLPQADNKSPILRSQIARCFEQIIKQLGPRMLKNKDVFNWDRILAVLADYINDSSPEVRFNARNALLSMENGINPVGNRKEIERYIKRVVIREFDQNKVLQIFHEGIERQKSLEASLHSFVSMAKSTLRQNSLYNIQDEGVSPKKQPGGSSVKKPQQYKIGPGLYQDQSYQTPNTKKQQSPVLKAQQQQEAVGRQESYGSYYPELPPQVQEQIQKELHNTLQVLLKQTNDQKKFALLNIAEATMKQKQQLLDSPLFEQALNQVILQSLLQMPGQNQASSSKAASVNLIEAEILYNILSEVHSIIPPEQISQVLKSVSPYLGSTNNQAKKNAENLIQKISAVYQARDISQALADSAIAAGTKGKIFLIDKLTQLIPQLNENLSPKKIPRLNGQQSGQKNSASLKFFESVIFPAVYRLLEEYMAGRGRNLPPDLKSSIDRLVKAVYDQHGSALIEKTPSNKLQKMLEIVSKEKKLQEQQQLLVQQTHSKPSLHGENENPNQHQDYLNQMEEAEAALFQSQELESLRMKRLKSNNLQLNENSTVKSGGAGGPQRLKTNEQAASQEHPLKPLGIPLNEAPEQTQSPKAGVNGPFDMDFHQEIARQSFKSINLNQENPAENQEEPPQNV